MNTLFNMAAAVAIKRKTVKGQTELVSYRS